MYREEYDGDLEFDLGNLMATGRSPLDTQRFKSEPDAACLEVATQMTQSLIARLFQLPSQAIPVRFAILAVLSETDLATTSKLPRREHDQT